MRWATVALTVMLVGCGQDPDLAQCEASIKANMKAPSTYKLIGYTPRTGALDYDATNPMGVPLREHGLCKSGIWMPDPPS